VLSNFFIDRPVFASVLAVVILLLGAISIPFLPIGEFPTIAPPTVQVNATYTGGNAQAVERSVTTPLEEQINGVEGMIYMSSTSANDGISNIVVTFESGYDLDIAAVDVQNRTTTARPQLPGDVVRQGVEVTKQSNQLTLAVNLLSPDGRYDQLFISNYASTQVANALKRIPGVGAVKVWGERLYAMRIWLDPSKLAGLGLSVEDVIDAVADQNQEVAAGSVGQPPVPLGQEFQFSLFLKGRLNSPEAFGEIILRRGGDGALVRLKDVSRIELGAVGYGTATSLDGIPSNAVPIYQLPGANALKIAAAVRETMAKLSAGFPEGLEYEIVYDTTTFVRESIREVLVTLAEAIALVFLAILLFLRSWKATLIPAITIPVCLLGTAALMLLLGFSINTLSLFGLVLAVGLVVDDAIVVVENVDRHMEAGTADRRKAARDAMAQVTSPVIATSLVLMAVFVPVGFIPGVTGALYKQFALTIACAVAISAFNALTLSPALCAIFLTPKQDGGSRFGRAFDAAFGRMTTAYEGLVRAVTRHWYLAMFAFLVMLFGAYKAFEAVPTGFIPKEDQGYFIVTVQLPEAAALERTLKVTKQVEAILEDTPGIAHVILFNGYSFVANTQETNGAIAFVFLKPWRERTTAATQIEAIMAAVHQRAEAIPAASVLTINPPVVHGISAIGGFDFELQDYTGGSIEELERMARALVAKASARPEIASVFSSLASDSPQYRIGIDRDEAKTQGVDLSSLYSALQTNLGGYYVNDINRFGQVYQVYLQAEGAARNDISDVPRIHVPNAEGDMVPLSGLTRIAPEAGVHTVYHYNLYRSASIHGNAADGYSSGQAMTAMEQVAAEVLPQGLGYEWTGNAYQELQAGNLAPTIFALSLFCAYLLLAALFESWVMPFIVILAVPLATFGALSAQWLRGLENDVYCQIGLVMLIGLASKNAILIVEFARRRREAGLSIVEAACEAARIRLRPILMTAFAFIFGVAPLLVATGAGANARHSLGTAVFGGMIASTFLSLILVPVLYVLIEGLREGRRRRRLE
jgi:hydrophobe/amphiphile efflux-1 (HAE1) family protein